MKECRIILADDHSILRDGMKSIISKFPEWKVVGEVQNGNDLLEMLKTIACDLVILDIAMPEMDGLTALKEINSQYSQIKVLMLSMLNDFTHFQKAKSFGASGFMSKEDAGDELPRAIEKILRGKMYIAPSVNKLLAERQLLILENDSLPSVEILTRREKQILCMIAQEMSNKQIALDLCLSIHTVENHRANLSQKLGLKNSVGLVKYAISKGLVSN